MTTNFMAMQVAGVLDLAGANTLIADETTPVKAIWNEADIGRIGKFLSDEELGRPAYNVIFSPSVLAAPYSLRVGMRVINSQLGYTGVVRDVAAPNSAHVRTIVVCVPE